jgi:hypothetical protein
MTNATTTNYSAYVPYEHFTNKQLFKTRLVIFLLLAFACACSATAQPVKPAVMLSQIEMSPSGGQPYDEFYWLNSNNASLTKSGVNFPVSGSYRCDISSYLDKGTPTISVSIDGVSKGEITINSSTIKIFSLLISNISAGVHTVTLRLTNFNSAANYGKVGLIYFTPTTESEPYVYPSITSLPFTPAVTMLTANHFGSGHLRGFCLGSNGSNQPDESDKNMRDMVATGANIARCFVEIERPSGSDQYQFKSGELTKLDTTVARGKRLGFYVVPVLFHDPSLNTDYWGNETKKSSIVNLWKTIASKYKGNPVIAAYDLINEPRQNFNYAECIRWQSDMIETIRKIDPDHVVMVECIENDMFAMMLPLAYSNVVYSPHGYSSIMITHEGVEGESAADIRNKYPSIKSTSNLPAPWGKTQLSMQHDDVRIMTHRFHVPVFIGEFSCINWAPMNDNGKWTSTEWINDNISLLEAEGWSWTYHTWRGDYVGWEAEIPSSYYGKFSFSNATPQGLPSYSEWIKARTDSAPTIVMLKKWFKLNAQDSKGVPGIRITNDTIYESEGTATVKVTLSDKSDVPVTLTYSTLNGTAVKTQDYGRRSNVKLTIPAGSTSASINIKITTDAVSETTEYFFVKLSNPVNADILDAKGKITIFDGRPLRKAMASDFSVADDALSFQQFTVDVTPNPSRYFFNLTIKSDNNEPLIVRISNLNGVILETRNIIKPCTFQCGENLRPGFYIIDVIQGRERKQFKVVKM